MKRYAAGIALLLVLAISAYVPALRGDFIWDDVQYVKENPLLKDADGLRRIWAEPRASLQYYPLVFTSFWVEQRFWGLNPLGYHLVNVLLHTLGAGLLWLTLARLGVPGAWLAAALFVLHPVHVESVAWITERKNTLSLPFFLASLAAYLRFSLRDGFARQGRSDPQDGRPAASWYLLSLLCFVLALLSRTTTAVLPVVALILLWWKKGRLGARDLVPLLPFFALGAGFGLLTAWLEMRHVGAVGADWEASPVERVLLAGRIVVFYLTKLLWPADLSFVYPRWQIDARAWWQYLFPGAVAAGVLALWRARGGIGRGHLAAALVFLCCLAPVLGFLKVYPMRFSYVADHFQYFASIGPLAWVAALLARYSSGALGGGRLRTFAQGPGGALVRRAGAAALLALLWALTWHQSRSYRDPETLWRTTIRRNPSAWLAHANLADILLGRGNAQEALEFTARAVSLKPGDAGVQVMHGKALYLAGRPAEAVRHLREALRLQPLHERARFWLVLATQGLGGARPTPGR
jgi:hypothetical protein